MDNGRDLCKIFNLSVKNWRLAIFLVAMATATLILFLNVVFELIEARISFYIFFWFSCRQFLFTMSVFREIRRKDLI